MSKTNNTALKNVSYNGQKVKKWYHNGAKVFSAGNVVTYYFNANDYAQEEIDSEASCLTPQTVNYINHFAGWTFVGWREDKTASSSVLSSKVMGDEPITLYAVYKRTLYLHAQSNGSVQSYAGTQYYNNGYVANPTIYVSNPGRGGCVFRGWSGSSSSTSIVNATLSGGLTISDNTYRYAVWTKTYSVNGTTLTCSNSSASPSTWKQWGYTTQTVNFNPDWSSFSSYTVSIGGSLDYPYGQPKIQVHTVLNQVWDTGNSTKMFSADMEYAYWAGFSGSVVIYPTYITVTRTYYKNPYQQNPTPITESFSYNFGSQITNVIVGGYISDNVVTGHISSTITGNGGSTFVS